MKKYVIFGLCIILLTGCGTKMSASGPVNTMSCQLEYDEATLGYGLLSKVDIDYTSDKAMTSMVNDQVYKVSGEDLATLQGQLEALIAAYGDLDGITMSLETTEESLTFHVTYDFNAMTGDTMSSLGFMNDTFYHDGILDAAQYRSYITETGGTCSELK